jgi:ribosome biogenesis GTPase A
MSLQWYPGHMAKAIREIKEALPKVDLVIEMLDARIPFSSENPVLNDFKKDIPRIKVLSKSDLADPEQLDAWCQYLEKEKNTRVLKVSTTSPERYRQLIPLIKKMLSEKRDGSRVLTVLICGIPNVGKSTLINTLADRAVAKTGNEAAVTKGQQRIKLEDSLMLLDTPGVLWPKVHNEHSAYRQAITGAIKEAITDNEDIAFYLADYLLLNYQSNLLERYDLKSLPDSALEFFEAIGKQKGALRSGGQVDLAKVCTLFLNDFRSGVLGEICLETPTMMETEQAEVERILEEKAAEKARKEAGGNIKRKTKKKKK